MEKRRERERNKNERIRRSKRRECKIRRRTCLKERKEFKTRGFAEEGGDEIRRKTFGVKL